MLDKGENASGEGHVPPKKIAKLAPEEAASALQEHLARYVELARAEGAVDARVIPAGDVVVDDRVPVKCRIPQCSVYGRSFNCPPNTMNPTRPGAWCLTTSGRWPSRSTCPPR